MDSSAIPKEMLEAKRAEIAPQRSAFEREAGDLRNRVSRGAITDDTIEQIQLYCQQARQGIEVFTFEDQLATIEALNIRGIVTRGATSDEDVVVLTG